MNDSWGEEKRTWIKKWNLSRIEFITTSQILDQPQSGDLICCTESFFAIKNQKKIQVNSIMIVADVADEFKTMQIKSEFWEEICVIQNSNFCNFILLERVY